MSNHDLKSVREERRYIQNQNRLYKKESFMVLDHTNVPECLKSMKCPPIAAWRSRHFLVQLFDENGQKRLSINRTDINRDGGWKDGITWDELQWIKNAVGFGDSYAVELYPADKEVVNVSNIRHLWIVPRPSFAWRKGE